MASRDNVRIVNQLIAGNAADAADRPSLAFGDADTGIYEGTDDNLTIGANSSNVLTISGSLLWLRMNTTTTPATSPPANTGYMFTSGGALYFTGSAGTTTRIAIA